MMTRAGSSPGSTLTVSSLIRGSQLDSARVTSRWISARVAEVLGFMRKSKGLSLKAAGKLCCIRSQAVAHIERGRWSVSREQAEKLVRSYGFPVEEYDAYMAGKEVPIDKREECMQLIRWLSADKLEAVYTILTSFVK